MMFFKMRPCAWTGHLGLFLLPRCGVLPLGRHDDPSRTPGFGRHYQPGREAAAGSASPWAESSGNSPSAADPSDSTYEPSRLEAWTEFHRQVEALPEEEREVVDLIWYEGLEQSEAAAFSRCSEGDGPKALAESTAAIESHP